jgi:hypothetical protein
VEWPSIRRYVLRLQRRHGRSARTTAALSCWERCRRSDTAGAQQALFLDSRWRERLSGHARCSKRQVGQFVRLWPGIARGGCVGVLRSVEHDEFARDDFGPGALLALAVLPGAIRESALDEDGLALGYLLRRHLGQPLVAGDAVPIGGRGGAGFAGSVSSEAEGQNRLTVGERRSSGVAPARPTRMILLKVKGICCPPFAE